MTENKFKVYVKVDKNNVVTEINSDIFILDTSNWIQIDEGTDGEKYARAQVNYLEKALMDKQFRCNYKLVENKVVELTEEEKKTLFPPTAPQATTEEIMNSLGIQLAQEKIVRVQNEKIIDMLGKELASIKIGGIK